MSDSLLSHGLDSPPGSSVHGISQARILEWVASSFSRGSSWLRDEPASPALAGIFFTSEPPGSPLGNQIANRRWLASGELVTGDPNPKSTGFASWLFSALFSTACLSRLLCPHQPLFHFLSFPTTVFFLQSWSNRYIQVDVAQVRLCSNELHFVESHSRYGRTFWLYEVKNKNLQ